MLSMNKDIVIIGGGIAGTSCLQSLLDERRSNSPLYNSITLISESRIIKRTLNHITKGRNLESFDVETRDLEEIYPAHGHDDLGFRYIIGKVICIDNEEREIHIEGYCRPEVDIQSHFKIRYDVLCLANGSSPKRIDSNKIAHKEALDRIITVRDTSSIDELNKLLIHSKKVAIIGNGGISLEIVNKLIDCDIAWIIRDDYVGCPLLDSGASKFLLEGNFRGGWRAENPAQTSGTDYVIDASFQTTITGPALGPHWLKSARLRGSLLGSRKLEIFHRSEVERISISDTNEHRLKISLQNAQIIQSDFAILAIGVIPNRIQFSSTQPLSSTRDGGILIDPEMRSSIREIYAAGDAACCDGWPQDTMWFQMRLWTQARQMGFYCGKCISYHLSDQSPEIFRNFDCFTHVTSFFDKKVVLLGLYNGQNLSELDHQKTEVVARVNRGKDYIKLVLKDDTVVGAIIVGDSNLEETIENLIHDQINIRDVKHQLLDDTIDIEDYFD